MGKTMPEKSIPKSDWEPGPWHQELDRIEWTYKGFPCLMLRGGSGAWCGYVAVPPGHPAFEKGYDDVDFEVHGGITYANHCHGQICHEPKEGEPDNVWWLGFDCAHDGDRMPALEALLKSFGAPDLPGGWGTYRTASYVRAEVESLVDQLAEMVKP